MPVDGEPIGSQPSRAKILVADRWSRGLINQSISKAQRGRCALQVGVIVTPRVWLKKDRTDYLYHQRCTFLFGKPTLKNSTVKRACWGAILGWVTSWVPGQRVSEDEARRKDL